jgi:hypothetical protein
MKMCVRQVINMQWVFGDLLQSDDHKIDSGTKFRHFILQFRPTKLGSVSLLLLINPYPANVDKMVGSYQC